MSNGGVDEKEMRDAATSGDVARIERLQASGQSVNSQDEGGFTPLHLAVKNGHVDAARKLLDLGASVDDNDNAEFITPIQLAYLEGDSHMIQLLWERSPEVASPSASPSPQSKLGCQDGSSDHDMVPRAAHRIEPGADNAHKWEWDGAQMEADHWDHFRLGLGVGVGKLTIKVSQIQNRMAPGGIHVYLRLGRKPMTQVFDARSIAPDKEGIHKVEVEAPKSGEWVIGITSGEHSFHGTLILSAEMETEEQIPDWIQELFAQADENGNGYVDTAELCEYLTFVNPTIKAEQLNASFACVNNARRLDLQEFYIWVTKSRLLVDDSDRNDNVSVNMDEISSSNLTSSKATLISSPYCGMDRNEIRSANTRTVPSSNESFHSSLLGKSGEGSFPTSNLGAVGRQALDLPCLSISDNVLTPIKDRFEPGVTSNTGTPASSIDPQEASQRIASLTEQVHMLQQQLDAKHS